MFFEPFSGAFAHANRKEVKGTEIITITKGNKLFYKKTVDQVEFFNLTDADKENVKKIIHQQKNYTKFTLKHENPSGVLETIHYDNLDQAILKAKDIRSSIEEFDYTFQTVSILDNLTKKTAYYFSIETGELQSEGSTVNFIKHFNKIKEQRLDLDSSAIVIRALRFCTGISQVKYAKFIDVSTRTVEEWESGRVKPRVEKIIELAEKIGIPKDIVVRYYLDNK